MKRTLIRLAQVRSAPVRHPDAGAPTGLTGLYTSTSPRATLRYLYLHTLYSLSKIPKESVYRRSTEALTKKRLSIIDAIEPIGHRQWRERTAELIRQEVGDMEEGTSVARGPVGEQRISRVGGEFHVAMGPQRGDELVDREQMEWDGEEVASLPEGLRGERTLRRARKIADVRVKASETPLVELDTEPDFTSEEVEEVEKKIGAGLIEEVIQVAAGELRLAGVMLKARVWEELEEKPAEGQWTYFTRDAHTSGSP